MAEKEETFEDLIRLSGITPEAIIADVDVDYATCLGKGSNAEVYAGTWQGAPVAVKELHRSLVEPGLHGREDFLRRFGAECNRLRGLRHENVVTFLGVTRSRDGTPALVTERLDVTLQKLYETKSLTPVEQLDILCDVAAGLEYVHSKGVMHRDLTPRNVLLTAGPRRRAKVADVGVSRSVHGDSLRDQMNIATSAMTHCPGTLNYMPPEALVDELPCYDQKLDLFSFGVLTVCTVLGREPSQDTFYEPRVEQLQNGERRNIPEVQRRRKDLAAVDASHPLRKVIGRCLQDDPERRPNAHQLHKKLLQMRESLSFPASHGRETVRLVVCKTIGEV